MSVVIIKPDIRGEERLACGNFHVDMFYGFMVRQGRMENIGGDSCCRPRTASTRLHSDRESWRGEGGRGREGEGRKEGRKSMVKITFRGCKDG